MESLPVGYVARPNIPDRPTKYLSPCDYSRSGIREWLDPILGNKQKMELIAAIKEVIGTDFNLYTTLLNNKIFISPMTLFERIPRMERRDEFLNVLQSMTGKRPVSHMNSELENYFNICGGKFFEALFKFDQEIFNEVLNYYLHKKSKNELCDFYNILVEYFNPNSKKVSVQVQKENDVWIIDKKKLKDDNRKLYNKIINKESLNVSDKEELKKSSEILRVYEQKGDKLEINKEKSQDRLGSWRSLRSSGLFGSSDDDDDDDDDDFYKLLSQVSAAKSSFGSSRKRSTKKGLKTKKTKRIRSTKTKKTKRIRSTKRK
jgi:hypothetical protein